MRRARQETGTALLVRSELEGYFLLGRAVVISCKLTPSVALAMESSADLEPVRCRVRCTWV